MDREWLAAELEAGRSIESIARDAGLHPSTLGYWVNKYGLLSTHAEKHSSRGGIARARLKSLVEEGRSVREIAVACGMSATSVRYWLTKYRLVTQPASYSRSDGPKPAALLRECAQHGWTAFVRVGKRGHYRCGRCNAAAVARRRRRIKEILVEEAGGACRVCGYARYTGALQFHHVDPTEKTFALSSRGLARSLAKARAEVAKCVLLCANCHAEVEAGLATIAPQSTS